jgi:hypothetical protein
MKKAERRRDQAEANYTALVAKKASANEIATARDEQNYARDQHGKAMDVYQSLIDATRPVASDTKRVVAFALNPDVRVRLARPFHEWLEGETFDVTGLPAPLGFASLGWQGKLYVRAEGLAVLRAWHKGSKPRVACFGTSGIGKSTLLQIAVLHTVAQGTPVLLHILGVNYLIELRNGSHWTITNCADVQQVTAGNRAKDIVLCVDSRARLSDHVGSVLQFKKALVVSGHNANTGKIHGIDWRFIDVPTDDELCAVAKIAGFALDAHGHRILDANDKPTGIDRAEALKRIDRYGPSIRYVCDPILADQQIKLSLDDLARRGIDGLALAEPATTVHRLTFYKRDNAGGYTLAFLSDDIRDRAALAMASRNASQLLVLANIRDVHGSLRGQIFENRMLDVLGRANSTVFLKTSGATTYKVLQIAGDGVTLKLNNKAYSLPCGGRQVLPGTLYRPPHSNNESWDAIFVESLTTAYLLQMTVDSEHPVKHNGIAAGEKFLFDNGFDKKGKVHIVFWCRLSCFVISQCRKRCSTSTSKCVRTARRRIGHRRSGASISSTMSRFGLRLEDKNQLEI